MLKRRSIIVASAIVAALVVLSAPAAAQSLTITAVTVSDFSAVSLDGTRKVTTATMSNFTVSDTRSPGGNWSVVVQASQFQEWDGATYVAGGKVLPAGSLSMPAPTVTAAPGTTSPAPTVAPGPYSIDGSSVTIATAGVDAGQGTYDFVQSGPLELTVPAGAYAVAYRSEITVSVAAGP